MELGTAGQTVAPVTFILQIAGSDLDWDFGVRDVGYVRSPRSLESKPI